MALSMKQMALLTSFFGFCSFLCGVIAENKKPASGTAIPRKDGVFCKYPNDPTVVLGYVSFGALIICTVTGHMAIFYPYNKRPIPFRAIFRSTTMIVFFNIAWLLAGLAAAMLIWPTITEQFQLSHTVHKNPHYTCPTAKTGVLGGGAFVSLDSCLIWLVCLMLVKNSRDDYFDEVDESLKGERSQLATADGVSLVSEALKHASVA